MNRVIAGDYCFYKCAETFAVGNLQPYCEFKQWRHTGKQLEDEGLAVEDVELTAAELDSLPQ